MSGRDPNSRQNVHASGENVISNSGAKVMSELHESKESAAISKMNSIDEHQAANPDSHWTDVCYNANKTRIVDLEDQVAAALANIQN